jgi:hypothetical protein
MEQNQPSHVVHKKRVILTTILREIIRPFEIPIPGYPKDILVESSTSAKCSESGRHDYKYPTQLYILVMKKNLV